MTRSRQQQIDRPIFIVGGGRSGSTLLYNIMAGHPDLAWFSNFTSLRQPTRFWITTSIVTRLYSLVRRHNLPPFAARFVPFPYEGYQLWNICHPVAGTGGDGPLTADDVTGEEEACVRELISQHMRYQRKPRFINKNTRNSRRVGYLDAMFPDARFIHIVRDPRAAVASLLKVDWWPNLEIWCENRVTPLEWAAEGKDPAMLAASLWIAQTQQVLDYEHRLGDRYKRIYYEDLTARPLEVMRETVAHCELAWSARFERFVNSFSIRSMNFKFKEQLNDAQITEIMRLTAPVVERLGYGYFD